MQTHVETCVVDVVDRVVAERGSHLGQTAQLAVEKRDRTAARAEPAAVEQLVTLALIDMAANFVAPSRANQIRIDVAHVGAMVALELVATGLVAGPRGMDYLIRVICAAQTTRYGGELHLDTSTFNRRILRISLPAA